jgi:hypothetical protein
MGKLGFEALVASYASGALHLYTVMLAVAVGSLVIYADDAKGRRWAHAAFVFVLVPGASWLLMAIAVPIAIFISGRPSRPGEGAEPR